MGTGSSDYDLLRKDAGEARTYLGTRPSFAAGRLAFTLGLRGPALAVDAACASSLIALHLACRSLREGECGLALAGAAHLLLAPDHFVQLGKIGALAPDGRSKTFSARADGFGRGEGVVVLVLERLADAIVRERTILAVVRGSAINHNGIDSAGIAAPSEIAQCELLIAALKDAGLRPDDIDLLECHGTGTRVGDPIEVRAISSVHANRPSSRPLRIGSVKPNLGHLEASAGLTGLAKILASLANEAIPPTIHTHPRNPAIEWDSAPVEVVDELVPWPRDGRRRRRASVSAFGISGINAHAIVEEPPLAAPRRAASLPVPSTLPLLISGRSPLALASQLERLIELVRGREHVDVLDLSYSLATSRTHFATRVAVMIEREASVTELVAALERAAHELAPAGAASDPAAAADDPAAAANDSLAASCREHLAGRDVDWAKWFRPFGARRMQLPTYAFTGERHWLYPRPESVPLLLAGASETQLRARAKQVHDHIAAHPHAALLDVAHALAGAARGRHRAAVVAGSHAGALDALAAVAEGRAHERALSGTADAAGKLVFAFPGQGSQWPRMATLLLASSPAFADTIAACERAFAAHVDWSLSTVLRDPSAARLLERVDVVQPVLFAMMVALAQVWREHGVRPDAVFGQSQGEIAAAYVAGALSLDDAAKIVCLRSRAIRALEGGGAMAAILQPRARLSKFLARFGARVSVAGDNGPSIVVAGEPEAIDELIADLAKADVFARRINVNYASHSAQVEAIRDELLLALAGIEPRAVEIPLYSTVDACWLDGRELDASYWYRNLRQTIRFADAVEDLLDSGHRSFIEVSPHPVGMLSLEVLCEQLGRAAVSVPTLRRDQGGLDQLWMAWADAWAQGCNADCLPRLASMGAGALEHELPAPADSVSAAASSASSPAASAIDRFWAAVDRGDLDELGEAMALQDDRKGALEQLLPALVDYRTRQLQLESVARLRYRVEWVAGARPSPGTGGAGPYLLVTSNARELLLPAGCDARVLELADDIGPEQLDAELRAAWAERETGFVAVVSLLGLDERPDPRHPMLPIGLSLNLALIQALLRRSDAAPLVLVTSGAVSVGAEDPLRRPAQAMCWGLARSLARAYPQRWSGAVDLDAGLEPERMGEALAAVFERVGGAEIELALRGRAAFVRRLIRAPRSSSPAATPVFRGAVLITGGTGALGGQFARWFARAGATQLILASRRGREAAGADELRAELEQLGAQVTIEACDVAVRESVAELFDRLRRDGVELRGVVHAAGVPGSPVELSALSRAQLAEVAAGKASGARWIHELVEEQQIELDHFVMLSSFWGVWGNAHVSAYAVANSYLDALVAHRRGLGRAATATAWGVWAGAGIIEDDVAAQLDRIGLRRIDPAAAMAAFAQILAHDEPAVVIADVDWPRLVSFYRSERPIALLEAIPELVSATSATPAGHTPGHASELEARALAPTEAGELLERVIARSADLLGLPVKRLDPTRGFSDMGLDSIMAVELRGVLERETGLTLPATFVFEHPCAQEAAAELAKRLGLALAPAPEHADPRETANDNGSRETRAPTLLAMHDEPIAIVGVGLRMPGRVEDLDTLFELLANEIDTVGPVPAERWDADAVYDPDPGTAGKTYVREASFVDGVDRFDPAFFNISPREAVRIDPQHRLLLEAAWEALERADVVPASLRASATGVFVGLGHSDYEFMQQQAGDLDAYTTLGTHGSFAAGRIAFALGLQGPAMTIDTACSSSLVALHLACRSLRAGECRLALAGGGQIMAGPDYGIQLARTQALAPDGRSKTFSANADGFGRGEGVVVIVLERLSDARRHGRRILGLVRGSAVNHDGASSGITVPNGVAQQKLIRAALADAALEPNAVEFVECHGTGTKLGDPIEVHALAGVYGHERAPERPLLLGSIKTNVGHLESAAGLAGVAKVLAAFRHEAIPASIHTRPRNPHLDWDTLAVEVVDALRPWPRRLEQPRRAAVSSFGLSGTNAHVILEDADPTDHADQAKRADGADARSLPAIAPLLLSARSERALREQALRLRAWLRARPLLRRGDLAYSLAVARTHLDRRVCVVDADVDATLAAIASGESNIEIDEPVRAPRLGLMFTGHTGAWTSPVALIDALPSFRAAFDDACRAFDGLLDRSLRELSLAAPSTAAAELLRERSCYAEPALFAFEYALARALEHAGARPRMLLGHSLGEFVAGTLAGVFELEHACRLVAARALAIDGSPRGREAFAAVARTVAYRAPRVPMISCSTGAWVEPAVLMTADYWVEQVGARVRLDDAARSLVEAGVTVLLELGPDARLAESVSVCFEDRSSAPLFSSALRRDRPALDSWAETLGRLHGHGVEIDWEAVFSGCDRRRVELPTYAFERARHWWTPQPATAGGARTSGARAGHPLLGPAFSMSVPTDASFFERELSARAPAWLTDHRIDEVCVFPGTGVIELLLAAARERIRGRVAIEQLRLHRPLVLREDISSTIQVALREAELGTWRASVSEQAGDGWLALSSARLVLVHAQPADEADEPTLAQLRERCLDRRDAEHLHAFTARCGYGYGPAFRGVEQLWLSDDESTVLARVSLPSAAGSPAPYVIHPALLDACLQLCLASGLDQPSAGPRMPTEIKRVTIERCAGAGPLWCVATTVPAPGAGGRAAGHLITDLRLFDGDGERIGRIEGLRTVPLERERGSDDDPRFADALLEPVWREREPLRSSVARPGRWLICCGAADTPSGRCATRLRACFEARGAVVEDTGAQLSPTNRAQIEASLDALPRNDQLAGVVCLWALDEPLATDGSPAIAQRAASAVLHLTQSLAARGMRWRRSPRLTLVTHRAQSPLGGAEQVRPEQGPCWGLGAVVRVEHGELQTLRVDLGDPDDPRELEALVAHALADDDDEDQVALRGAAAHVLRLVRAHVPALTQAPRVPQLASDRLARRLVIDAPGSLERLRLESVERREPGPGEVEITVQASGLNFRDVLLATGVVPPIGSDRVSLGFECAGTITALGPETDGLALGDRVLALTRDGLATHVLAPAQLVLRVPDGPAGALTWAEAVTLPQVQISAYYALHRVAGLRAGERVLIHSATGGVGLAALQWARHVGAEIFATASSEDKRAWLREQGIVHVSDSRSDSFVEQILDWTHGQGVDVVLSALPGELMRRSLELLRHGGRYVDLGLRDALADGQLDLAGFARGIGYTLVNVGELIVHAPLRVRELFEEVLEHVRTGVLAPLPHREAPLSRAPELLWEMGRGRHIGKLVVVADEPAARSSLRVSGAPVSADASYLITGGLGGLGLSLARWMAERGAGELVLVGRSGVTRDAQREAISAMQASGARVRVEALDVAEPGAVAGLIATLSSERPLRGIVHAAAVLEDAMLVKQTIDSLARVMAPKVAGAWQLHQASAGLELDFFVLFGSVASVIGSPGQGNYVAANGYLDALARQRRSLRLPALCLSWGPFAEIGLAAADARRGPRLVSRGLREFSVEEGLELFERLLSCRQAQLVACRFELDTWTEFYPEAASWADLSELARELTRSTGSNSSAPLDELAKLASHSPTLARTRLLAHVVGELARITRMDAELLEPSTPFAELGIDSLMGIELRNRLRATTGVELSVTAIWTHPTPDALASELLELIRGSSLPEPEPEPEPEADADAEADAEAEAVFELDEDAAMHDLLAELDGLGSEVSSNV